MKNVHLIPTDKPSRLCYVICTEESTLTLFEDEMGISKRFIPQHIYITNSEEIKEGDYGVDTFHKEVRKFRNRNFVSKYDKKIILTTDQYLIADSVQAIDDEFLQWFVKNPNHESVKVRSKMNHPRSVFGYEIIIP